MSWGDGKYFDYCFKLKDEIEAKAIKGNELICFLRAKYSYVSRVANVDWESFENDIYELLD